MLETDQQRAWAEVDYDAIAHNVREIEKIMGNTRIMGIVKADAYGHGDVACALALEKAGVDYFAVACLDEAERLRAGGIAHPILILGYTPPAAFERLHQGGFVQSLLSKDYALQLNDWAMKRGVKMPGHVKIDTGMNRTGILYEDNARHFEELADVYQMEHLDVQGIFSHFPVSDDLCVECRSFTLHQMDLFDEAIQRLQEMGIEPGLRHIQNSYGILNYMDRGYDYCRPGLLYMGVTSDDSIPIETDPDFIPILSLKTRVSMVKTIPAGATVSYGRHFKAEKPTRIASLSIGYADGLPRSCSNHNLEVLIRGHRVPLVGNICMDQCMANITGYDDIQSGDEVVVVGRQGNETVTVDTISRIAGTINNETLTRLSARVPRLKANGLSNSES